MNSTNRQNDKGTYLKEIFDSGGNFLGYTEKVSEREYNHFDQELRYLGSTEDGFFDFIRYKIKEE